MILWHRFWCWVWERRLRELNADILEAGWFRDYHRDMAHAAARHRSSRS